MAKALFFDVDGTLVNFHGQMPASALSALKSARSLGHQVVICTGRGLSNIYPHLLEIADGVIASSGATVRKGDAVIFNHCMPAEDILRVQDVIRAAGGCMTGQADTRSFFSQASRDRFLARMTALKRTQDNIDRMFRDAVITEEARDYADVKKIIYFQSSWSVERVAEALADICDVTPSSFEKVVTDSGEICTRGINKSRGIAEYIRSQGIAWEDTVAFGDADNDLDMLEYVHTGVAMGNARENVKAAADFVTKHIDDDGIFYAMDHLGLLK